MFLVAGINPRPSAQKVVRFHQGFTACHQADWNDVIDTCKQAEFSLAEIGVSNVKLNGFRNIQFCMFCGSNLQEFYGEDGGALRDDEFIGSL